MRERATHCCLAVLALGIVVAGCAGPGKDPEAEPPPAELAAIAEREWARDADLEFFGAQLAGTDPRIRSRAVLALGRIQDPGSVALLGEVAQQADLSRELAIELAFALGQIGEPEAWPALEVLGRHQDAEVRARAVEALGRLRLDDGDERRALVAARIAEAFADDSPVVRGHACHAAWRRGGTEHVAALTRLLEEKESPEVRWRACYALARIDDPLTTAPVKSVIADPNPWVRTFAARGLSTPVVPEAPAILRALLADPVSTWLARVEAARTLGEMRLEGIGDDGEIRDVLLEHYMREKHVGVRDVVIAALAAGDGDRSVEREFIESLIDDRKSRTEHRALLVAYGRVAKSAARPRLASYVREDDRWLRAAAARGLGFCGEEALPDLRAFLADDDSLVRLAVVDALETIGTESCWELIRTITEDTDVAVRCAAVDKVGSKHPAGWVETLVAAFEASGDDAFWELRRSILRSLKEETDSVKPLAERSVQDPFVIVRREALAILGKEPLPGFDMSGFPAPLIDRRQIIDLRNPRVHLRTSKGDVILELYLDEAPLHVANIIHQARRGFYDGLYFHRVVPSFVIQGGDPWGNGWGDDGYHIPNEINRKAYLRGALGMPTAGKDTGGCQIFITHLPTPHLDGNYTVFGRVVAGMKVVDRIEVGDVIESAAVDEFRFREEARPAGTSSGK